MVLVLQIYGVQLSIEFYETKKIYALECENMFLK